MSEDDRSKRTTPAENDADWGYLFAGAKKGHDAWSVVGPIYAVKKNWKAWLVIAGIAIVVNSKEVIEALKILLEAVKL